MSRYTVTFWIDANDYVEIDSILAASPDDALREARDLRPDLAYLEASIAEERSS